MNIEINGGTYNVPQDYVQKLSQDLLRLGEQMYEEKTDDKLKSLLMVLTRGLLVKAELDARAQYGKEAARAVRPPPKSDPNVWVMRLLLPAITEMLNHATITCETTAETVTAFSLSLPSPGSTGGQVGADRDKWVWEDNSTKVP